MRNRARNIRDDRGNIAVEFALIAPLFIAMALGLADYGHVMLDRAAMDAAARAGLQVLLRDTTNTTGAAAAVQALVPDATVQATLSCVCPNGTAVACSPGTCPTGVPKITATVGVTTTESLLVPWPTLTDPVTLTATAVGRLK